MAQKSWSLAERLLCLLSRPRLTPNFFKHLDKMIGMERFGAKPDQDRLAELDSLREYLQ
eukprot:evm.model.scf_1568.1 EVM.evm.TU.scf_1568.1   scf_1568:18732-18905(+)